MVEFEESVLKVKLIQSIVAAVVQIYIESNFYKFFLFKWCKTHFFKLIFNFKNKFFFIYFNYFFVKIITIKILKFFYY